MCGRGSEDVWVELICQWRKEDAFISLAEGESQIVWAGHLKESKSWNCLCFLKSSLGEKESLFRVQVINHQSCCNFRCVFHVISFFPLARGFSLSRLWLDLSPHLIASLQVQHLHSDAGVAFCCICVWGPWKKRLNMCKTSFLCVEES